MQDFMNNEDIISSEPNNSVGEGQEEEHGPTDIISP